MIPKEFVESLVRAADSDAADNKPKCDVDTEQSYCASRLSLLVTDMISRENPSWKRRNSDDEAG
jgi:hypothetical protein